MQSMPQPELTPQLVQNSRTNLSDLKSQIGRWVGREVAQCYFRCLNELLTGKLSKPEFNKLCLFTIGRENLSLHNQLIGSILRNACQAREPPPFNHDLDVQNPKAASGSLYSPTTSVHISSNGTISHPPPCKFSTSLRCRYAKDITSLLEPNERPEVARHQSPVSSAATIHRENGDLKYQQDRSAEHLAKKPRLDKLSHDQISLHGKDFVEVETVEWGDRLKILESCRGPLRAPLGIPFCSASIGGGKRCPLPTVASSSGGLGSSYVCGELCHTEVLKIRMEKIAESLGLGGVTLECSNLLNNGLDAYLKRLICSCSKLVQARNGNGLTKQQVPKQQQYSNPTTGSWAGNNIKVQRISGPSEGRCEMKNCCSMSTHDFKVAMALNPWVLGEDWPLLHEKICLCSFEE